jgi:hypothetical protein
MKKMKKSRAILLSMCVALFATFTINAQSAQNPPLKLIQSIPVPGLEEGKFNHFGEDLKSNRLDERSLAQSSSIYIAATTEFAVYSRC